MMNRLVESNLALAVGVVGSWGLLTAALMAFIGRGPTRERKSRQPRFESVTDAPKCDDSTDVR